MIDSAIGCMLFFIGFYVGCVVGFFASSSAIKEFIPDFSKYLENDAHGGNKSKDKKEKVNEEDEMLGQGCFDSQNILFH